MSAPPEKRSPPGETGGLGMGRRCDLDTRTLIEPASNCKTIDRAKLELLRDAVIEALGYCRLYAEVAMMLADVGDDAGVLNALGNFHAAAKIACQAGREIRDLRSEARQ